MNKRQKKKILTKAHKNFNSLSKKERMFIMNSMIGIMQEMYELTYKGVGLLLSEKIHSMTVGVKIVNEK